MLRAAGIPFTESFPQGREREEVRRAYAYDRLPIILLAFRNGRRRVVLGSDVLEKYLADRSKRG